MCLDFGDDGYAETLEEAIRLVQSAGIARVEIVRGKRARPDARFFAGSGKVGEIRRAA